MSDARTYFSSLIFGSLKQFNSGLRKARAVFSQKILRIFLPEKNWQCINFRNEIN